VRSLFLILLSVVVTALCWRNLYQAWTKGTVVYQPHLFDRRNNPTLFWLVVAISGLFGIAGPYLFLVAVLASVTGDWSAFR
jgi:hypothetical protein